MKTQKDEPCDATWDQHGFGECKNCKAMLRSGWVLLTDPGCPNYVAPTKQHAWDWKDIPTFRMGCLDCGEEHDGSTGVSAPMGPCVPKNLAGSSASQPQYVPGLSPSPSTWALYGLDVGEPDASPAPALRPSCSSCGRELCDFLDATYEKDLEGLCSKCQRSHRRSQS